MGYQPHEQRVIDEREELNGKIEKLNTFIGGDIFNGLDSQNQLLLTQQAVAMQNYLDILDQRIALFPPSGEHAPTAGGTPPGDPVGPH